VNLDAAFYPALVQAGNTLGVPAGWLLNVFYLESRLNPQIGNQYGYVGLNQLASSQLKQTFGVNPSDYLAWPASQQLTQVILPWYQNTIKVFGRGTPRSPGVLYALNLFPNSVKTRGDSEDTVLISSRASSSYEVAAYYANANGGKPNSRGNCGLDFDCSGQITIGDLDNFLAQLTADKAYQSALATLNSYGGASSVSLPASGTTFVQALLTTIALGGIGFLGFKELQKIRQARYETV
jgi:hypothetical protein